MPSTNPDNPTKSAESTNLDQTGREIRFAGSAPGLLRSFFERIEWLTEQGRSINRDKAEVFAEAKSRGFDTVVMKTVLKRRAQDRALVELHDELVQLYERESAAGIVPNGHAAESQAADAA